MWATGVTLYCFVYGKVSAGWAGRAGAALAPWAGHHGPGRMTDAGPAFVSLSKVTFERAHPAQRRRKEKGLCCSPRVPLGGWIHVQESWDSRHPKGGVDGAIHSFTYPLIHSFNKLSLTSALGQAGHPTLTCRDPRPQVLPLQGPC